MFENWEDITIGKVYLAVYVIPGTGTKIHTDRYAHGLILNDSNNQNYRRRNRKITQQQQQLSKIWVAGPMKIQQ